MSINPSKQSHQEFVAYLHKLIMHSIHEILGTLKSPPFVKRLIEVLFFFPIRYFAKFFAEFDERTKSEGFPAAGRWLCDRFVTEIKVRGGENVLESGPIMVVSNHPGAYDSFCILATLGRRDLNAIISDIPFCMAMPNVAPNLIHTNSNVDVRMVAIREAIKRLQNGIAFLIFPTGLIDPDPSFMDNAVDELKNWSKSIELFLRRAPDTRLLITTVSHVLQPKWTSHVMVKTQHTVMTKRRMAEFVQVLNQFFIPWSKKSIPCISYGKPISYGELKKMEGGIQENIIRLAGEQMKDHMEFYNQT